MHIKKLTIKNFRSFGPDGAVFHFDHKLNAFIGSNSAGKTAALEALRKMFGVTFAEREIVREDFHINEADPSEQQSARLSIEVKIAFDGDEVDTIPSYFNYMVVDEEGAAPYLRIRLEATWTKSFSPSGNIEAKLSYIRCAEGEEESDDNKSLVPNHQRAYIEVFYVPAIRRPSEQIKYASGSILHRVLRRLKMDEAFQEQFEESIASINDHFRSLSEFDNIQKTLTSFWEKFHKDQRYKEANLSFSGSDITTILKKIEITFSPTGLHRKFYVDDLGEGYRSLFYLTLVCSLLDLENKIEDDQDDVQRPFLTLLAIEEPENHIAPQLLGRVVSILLGIARQKNSQVLISSHTPAIVKRLNPDSIFHFRINEVFQTEVNRIVLPPDSTEAYKYIKEAVQNYPEIYFARLVVIGEGDSEEVVFNRLMKVYETDFDDNFISFVPLGHRFVNHIWKLLDSLHIPYITLLDLDRERAGGGWGRIKYIITQLLKKGIPKEVLLQTSTGILSEDDLSNMHKWDPNSEHLAGWVSMLEKYDVFFSSPLDLDFLFLEHYPEQYKAIIPGGGGPRIPNKAEEAMKYEEKILTGVTATLKSEAATGETYTEEQRELMTWYNYHFLGRGKPSTHIQALSTISDEELIENIPSVIEKMFQRIEQKLLA